MSALPMVAPGALLGGRYRVVRELGRGGMGVVYEALQQDLNRRVALKVLLAFGGGPQLERFRREAHSAAALGHPNIVQVTDFQTPSDGPPFLVMELLEGSSLGSLIDTQGPLPYPRVAFITTQVLAGLAAAHRAGIVHRDIKPDNVFLTSTSVAHDLVKLLDFGIAKVESSDAAPMTSYGQVMGTPAYMPPEQARGAQVDARSDVFAVGATMYHAITGRLPTPPADGSSATMEAPRSIMAAAALSLLRPDLPTGFTAIVDRAMMPDPAARYATADEMRAALAMWSPPTSSPALESAPRMAPPSSAMPSTQMPSTAMPSTAMPSTAMPPTFMPPTQLAQTQGSSSMTSPPSMASAATMPSTPSTRGHSLPPAYVPPSFGAAHSQPLTMYPRTAAPEARKGMSGALIAALVIVPSLALIAVVGLVFFMLSRAKAPPPAAGASNVPDPSSPASAAVPTPSSSPDPRSPRTPRPIGSSRSAPASPATATATVPGAAPATPSPTAPPAAPGAAKKVQVTVGGSFAGRFSNPNAARQAVEAKGPELALCFQRFNPLPETRAQRDYQLTLDVNARPIGAQPNNDAVDRCVTPILMRAVFPAFTVPVSSTFVVEPRVTWSVAP
jgi:eukaryotic-like serine/threonine-protein kinase